MLGVAFFVIQRTKIFLWANCIVPCWGLQSSQVDLLAKSEICDGVTVVCHTAGITPLGESGDMLPQEILKNGSS